MDGRLLFLGLVLGILVLAWLGAGVLWRAAEVAELVAPIDPVAFDELSVVAIGTGNEYENPERHGPSTLIGLRETTILVDAGRGVAEGLRSAGIPLDQPNVVLLTNLANELDAATVARKLLASLSEPIEFRSQATSKAPPTFRMVPP